MQQYLPIAGNPVNQTTKNHPMEVILWGWPYPLSFVIYLIYQSITKYDVKISSCSNHAENIKFTREKLRNNDMLVVANKVSSSIALMRM